MSYFKIAILGGTFDRFHAGHVCLIDAAFKQSEKVIIGISKPSVYKNKLLAGIIENYETREGSVKKYLQEQNLTKRATIIPIVDIYGNTLEEKNIEAIFVTKANLPNVHLINKKRKEQSFPQLKIVVVPYVKGNDGKMLTSERIRSGEIDRNGNAYEKNFTKKKLILPDDLRGELRKPAGNVFKNTEKLKPFLNNNSFIVAVGDIVLLSLIELGYRPAIGIVDLRTRRHPLDEDDLNKLELLTKNSLISINKPGTISKSAVNVFKSSFKKYLLTRTMQTILVKGEEDLITLPAILLAPLGSIVLYGQFDVGVVAVTVTEEKKKQIAKIIAKFD